MREPAEAVQPAFAETVARTEQARPARCALRGGQQHLAGADEKPAVVAQPAGLDGVARVFDPGLIDGIVNGVATVVAGWARGLRRVQTGYVMNYALGILLGAVAVVAYLLARR